MKLFSSSKRKQSGFTLLEILVVVSIIGILIVLGAAAFSVDQQKGRDARRRGDLKSIQNAFEQHYAASGTSSYAANCAMTGQFSSGALPTDPKGGAYDCSSDSSSYCVCATLESDAGNSSDENCSYGGTSHFCVSQLQ